MFSYRVQHNENSHEGTQNEDLAQGQQVMTEGNVLICFLQEIIALVC